MQNEGQRYQRRPPFPLPGDQPKTTRRKIEPRIVLEQLRNVKIVSRSDNFNSGPQPSWPINKECRTILPAALFPILSQSPAGDRKTVEDRMSSSNYWDETSRQQISPDLVGINPDLFQQTQKLCDLESIFLSNLAMAYREEINSQRSSDLIDIIEGNLAGSSGMGALRSWSLAAEDPNLFRLDLGIENGNPFVCEANLISCGTPPAMLYREAQGPVISQSEYIPAANGSLEYFFDALTEKPDPEITILGTTPTTASQLLYEKSHTDMANILVDFGITAYCCRLLDLAIDGDNLRKKDGDSVKNVYWFGDPISANGNSELNSDQGKLLLKKYKQGDTRFLATPLFAFADNKAVDALVWDNRFKDLVPEGLKDFVPQTEIVSPESKMCQKAFGLDEAWKQFILKPTISIGGAAGVIIGAEKPRETFLSSLKTRLLTPGSAIIQELKRSPKIHLRTFENGTWKSRGYYPRLEPTAVVKNKKSEIIDLFFTDRPETRKVGGASNCVMSTVVIKERDNL
ncbi:MAG: hypothetical protein UV19_C0023G0008 [Parcubacteria group bacterium GW2011_GWA2_42_28]|nr:MAG: hypothetical protein UV19_C0023G0008 [Parcubacteria group bacterium GW2011_GWA2_42_28]